MPYAFLPQHYKGRNRKKAAEYVDALSLDPAAAINKKYEKLVLGVLKIFEEENVTDFEIVDSIIELFLEEKAEIKDVHVHCA